MSIDTIINQIKQIELIANTQATLVQRAGASNNHTKMVLKEIVERCRSISSPNAFNNEPLDDEDIEFFSPTIAFCEATRYEQYAVWQRMCNDPDGPNVSWKTHSGRGITIGYLDGRPVHVSFSPVDVAGYRIMFVEITSTVADHEMLREWVKTHMPEGVPTRIGDATNFVNCLPDGWRSQA